MIRDSTYNGPNLEGSTRAGVGSWSPGWGCRAARTRVVPPSGQLGGEVRASSEQVLSHRAEVHVARDAPGVRAVVP